MPAVRGPRGLDAARDLGAAARGRRARHARLARPRGAEQVPAAGRSRRRRQSPPTRSPRAAATRSSSRRRPPPGAHEVIVHAPEHVSSMSDLSAEQPALAMEGWRERARALGDSAYVHMMVNEGQAAGASLEHTHAQLYGLGFVPDRGRPRARALHRPQHPHAWAAACSATCSRRRCAGASVSSRSTTRRCCWRRMPSRMPYELQLVPRKHERELRRCRRRPARRCCTTVSTGCAECSARRRR